MDWSYPVFIIAKNLTFQIKCELLYYVKIFIIQLQFDLLCENKKSKKHDKKIGHTCTYQYYFWEFITT